MTGPIARPRISKPTLRTAPTCVTSESCRRLTSIAGSPAGVNLSAARSTIRAVSASRLIVRPRLPGSAPRFLAVDRLHHDRWRGLGAILDDGQVTKHGVVEAKAGLELVQHLVVALDVDAEVVRLGELLDHVGHLATAPVLDPVHLAAAGGDGGLVAFQHGRNLFALIGMDQEHDLVMTHGVSLWIPGRKPLAGPIGPRRGTSRPDAAREEKPASINRMGLCRARSPAASPQAGAWPAGTPPAGAPNR